MYHQRQPLSVGLATAALFTLLLTFGCSSSTPTGSSAATPPQPTAVLGASGSTFIAPLMAKWVSAYQQTHPTVVINYRPIGSGGGIEEMKKGYLSFGASDAPLDDDQAQEMSGVIQVPSTLENIA
jgi:phosphate transport system substrate-binding protein